MGKAAFPGAEAVEFGPELLVEASALQLRQGIGQGAGARSGPLLRLRSDEQLVALFRAGSEEAFRVIHDRYRRRLLAYARQMLAGRGHDAEDALQDVFERAYCGLRANDRDLVLKAWLYRVAHNRCIDQLRSPMSAATPPEETESRQPGPIALAEQRETLRRLIVDVQRLPDQQRSALLLREMSGLSYAELATTLDVSVPAVKSLLVRARMSLVAASQARDTACSAIREELVLCHDRGVRPSGMARRHLRDCQHCRTFRRSVRGVSRSLTALAPTVGPVGILIRALTGGGAAGPGGMLGSGSAAAGGAAAGGAAAGGGVGVSTGIAAGGVAASTAGHVATLLAAALVTAGGAVAVQQAGTQTGSGTHVRPSHHLIATPLPYSGGASLTRAVASQVPASQSARAGQALGAADHVRADRDKKSATSGRRASRQHHRASRSTASTHPSAARSTGPASTAGSASSAADSQSSSSTAGATSVPTSPVATGTTPSGATGTTSGPQRSTGGAAISPGRATGGASSSSRSASGSS